MSLAEQSKAVFISYAKQDADAALRLCEALRAGGVEVWFDQSELRGGDAWDAAIRRQIKTCALLIPVISANTRGRAEGYFRLEWKLAIDRSHLMSQDRAFLLPVVVDDTEEGDERVPDKFREIQWTRLPGGHATPHFTARVRRLLDQDSSTTTPSAPATVAAAHSAPTSPSRPAGTSAPLRRSRVVLAAVAILLCAGVGAWVARHRWSAPAAVVPYSNEDRRMTFAVLPLQVSSDDAQAARVAKATGTELVGMLEDRNDLVSVIASASAAQAVTRETAMRRIATLLDVHFLVRGTVARSGTGYKVTILCVDGDSERVLATKTLAVAEGKLVPDWRNEVRQAVGELLGVAVDVEAQRARKKDPDAWDVRDLAFIANRDWHALRDTDGKKANESSNALLNRALAIAPNDPYALRNVAIINLCDCVNSWSPNPDEQKAVGAAAMEKLLRINPNSLTMLYEKASLYQLRLRWDESIVIADGILAREPDDPFALSLKAAALLRLGQLTEARRIDDAVLARAPNDSGALSSVANVCYAQADYDCAASSARKAVAQMDSAGLNDRVSGPVQLTLIAAEARLKHAERARQAVLDFTATVPNVKTLGAIKAWVHPSAELADSTALYDGLRLAGIAD